MKVLITGSSGYLGTNLAKFLIGKGVGVKGYDITDDQDILNLNSLINAMKGCKYVYHCAAISDLHDCDRNRKGSFRINVAGTEAVMITAKQTKTKPILFSSDKMEKLHMYGTTKRLLELLYENRAVILRLATVFGGENFFEKKPNQFVTHLAKDNPIKLFNVKETKNFVHISEVMNWCLKAQTLPYGIYDVFDMKKIPIKTMGFLAGTIRGVDVEICES